MTILRAGSKGADVENLQVRLRRLGLLGEKTKVTGVFGAGTTKAVKQYERAHKLTPDGFVTEKEALLIKRDSLKSVSRQGLEVGDRGARVRDLQNDLAGLGFYNGDLTGRFNPAMQVAVKRFERANNLKPDGVADLKTEGMLDRQMARLTGAKRPNAKAPPSDYHRVVYRGGLMNVRTKVMLRRAELYLPGAAAFSVTQGSYNKGGVAASAGTHDGGGALDISVRGKSPADIGRMVKALRQAGFAAWSRGPADGMTPHIHAIAIGDREAAPLAKSQMQNYFAGRNGLANNGIDPNRRVGRPFPTWATKFD